METWLLRLLAILGISGINEPKNGGFRNGEICLSKSIMGAIFFPPGITDRLIKEGKQ